VGTLLEVGTGVGTRRAFLTYLAHLDHATMRFSRSHAARYGPGRSQTSARGFEVPPLHFRGSSVGLRRSLLEPDSTGTVSQLVSVGFGGSCCPVVAPKQPRNHRATGVRLRPAVARAGIGVSWLLVATARLQAKPAPLSSPSIKASGPSRARSCFHSRCLAFTRPPLAAGDAPAPGRPRRRATLPDRRRHRCRRRSSRSRSGWQR
jgi:hypothetical protein